MESKNNSLKPEAVQAVTYAVSENFANAMFNSCKGILENLLFCSFFVFLLNLKDNNNEGLR